MVVSYVNIHDNNYNRPQQFYEYFMWHYVHDWYLIAFLHGHLYQRVFLSLIAFTMYQSIMYASTITEMMACKYRKE